MSEDKVVPPPADEGVSFSTYREWKDFGNSFLMGQLDKKPKFLLSEAKKNGSLDLDTQRGPVFEQTSHSPDIFGHKFTFVADRSHLQLDEYTPASADDVFIRNNSQKLFPEDAHSVLMLESVSSSSWVKDLVNQCSNQKDFLIKILKAYENTMLNKDPSAFKMDKESFVFSKIGLHLEGVGASNNALKKQLVGDLIKRAESLDEKALELSGEAQPNDPVIQFLYEKVLEVSYAPLYQGKVDGDVLTTMHTSLDGPRIQKIWSARANGAIIEGLDIPNVYTGAQLKAMARSFSGYDKEKMEGVDSDFKGFKELEDQKEYFLDLKQSENLSEQAIYPFTGYDVDGFVHFDPSKKLTFNDLTTDNEAFYKIRLGQQNQDLVERISDIEQKHDGLAKAEGKKSCYVIHMGQGHLASIEGDNIKGMDELMKARGMDLVTLAPVDNDSSGMYEYNVATESFSNYSILMNSNLIGPSR